MAIKVGGTTVIDDSRNVDNIGTIKGLSYPSADGTAGQFLKTDGAGNLAFQTVQTDPTIATLTKSFASGETASITLSQAITTAPVVSVIKEVPQTGVSSKGSWDVASDGGNYERHDTAYDTTLTPASVGYGPLNEVTYDNKNFNLYSLHAYEYDGLYVRDDGLMFYAIDADSGYLSQYSMSTAHDITTASFVRQFEVKTYSGIDNAFGVFFKPDGTRMFIATTGAGGQGIAQVELSTPWDISTTSYTKIKTTGGSIYPSSVYFTPDGSKFFITDWGPDVVREYSLGSGLSAWDVHNYSATATTVSTPDTTPACIFFSSDGTRMYTGGTAADQDISVHTLSTPFDLSTATRQTSEDILILSETGQYNWGLGFSDSGKKMYVLGANSNRKVFQYTVPTTDLLVLGSGSFSSSDVGKQIEGNGGKAVLTEAHDRDHTQPTRGSQVSGG